MVTTKSDIERWIYEAPKWASHMAVICDTFDFSNYPVYIRKESDVSKETKKHNEGKNMGKLTEIYDLRMNIDNQLDINH